MEVVLREVRTGDTCRIYAYGTKKTCQLREFIEELRSSHNAEFNKILALLDRTAAVGPPRNKEKCRFFQDIQVFEFKSPGGVRIMAFWDENRMIVCSHGFIKKSRKTPRDEKEKARKTRAEYFAAKKEGRIVSG